MKKSNSRGEGQNYLVSVSDLMAGLLFLFIITIVVFALRLSTEIKNQAEQTRIATEKKASIELVARQLTDNDNIRRELLLKIKNDLEKAGFKVVVNEDQGILSLPEEVLFPSGSADLQPKGKQLIEALAKIFSTLLPDYMGRPGLKTAQAGKIDAIFFEGHTDNVPVIHNIIRYKDNWELSAARAISTYHYLIYYDPLLDALKNTKDQPIFSVSGYADRRPVALNDTDDNKHHNRRIDIRFIMTPPKETYDLLRNKEIVFKEN
jgi:chemotaxis protein MotB